MLQNKTVRKYDTYKDSGIEWIDEIPQEWKLVKTGRVFRNTKEIVGSNSVNVERLALTLNGVIKRDKDDAEGLQPEQFDGYQYLRKNQMVFKLIDLENVNTSRVGLCPFEEGMVSPAYIVLKNNQSDNRYYHYYFLSLWHNEIFNHLGGDGVRSALNAKDLLNIPTFDLSKEMQQRIAEYLDKKCGEIDRVIETEKSVIEKLKEYKQSIITEAVTKGLDKSVPLKDSGIEWIGKIPQYWNIVRLKYKFRIKKDIAGKEGFDILSVTQRGLKIKDITTNEGQLAMDYSKYQLVEPTDFVMNHMDLLTGWVDCSTFSGVTSPDYRVFLNTDLENCNNEYYKHIFQTCYRNKIFFRLGQGVSDLGRWRLQADKFLNFVIPIPPMSEQEKINNFINNKCSEIDKAIADKEQLIEKFTEYKKSLIYECVTGKRKVVT